MAPRGDSCHVRLNSEGYDPEGGVNWGLDYDDESYGYSDEIGTDYYTDDYRYTDDYGYNYDYGYGEVGYHTPAGHLRIPAVQ